MSTWTYVLTNNTGKVRLLIGDTDITPTTDAQFSDEEIGVFLAMASNSILIAAAYALEAWASALTGSLTSEKIGDYAYTKKEAETKANLAKEYKKQESENPYLTWAEMDLTIGSGITAEED